MTQYLTSEQGHNFVAYFDRVLSERETDTMWQTYRFQYMARSIGRTDGRTFVWIQTSVPCDRDTMRAMLFPTWVGTTGPQEEYDYWFKPMKFEVAWRGLLSYDIPTGMKACAEMLDDICEGTDAMMGMEDYERPLLRRTQPRMWARVPQDNN